MNDPEGDAYYARKQQRAEEAATLYMKVTFYLIVFGVGYALGIWIGNIFA